MKRIAIIGAGVAGLAAAVALRGPDATAVVFEKSRGFGGRAATRGREGVRYDHGANYFTAVADPIRALVYDTLPADDLIAIRSTVQAFPASAGAPDGDTAPARLNYTQGISQLGKLMAAASGAEVRRQTRIARLVQSGNHWSVESDDGRAEHGFDAVLLAAPAPQSAAIVEASTMDGATRDRLSQGLREARYVPQMSFVMGYAREVLAADWYALIDAARTSPASWIAREEAKEGHVPHGRQVLLVQMAPAWSAARYEEAADTLWPDVLTHVREAIGSALPEPDWRDMQRWRFARPESAVDARSVATGEALGLFVAGDGVAGVASLERAIETGMHTAARMLQ